MKPGSPLRLKFVTSADDVLRLPHYDAEVAVVGRSNVGKSSLLNALANQRQLAKTSKTPGRTQLLNCFELDESGSGKAAVIDCPGYGYAAAPKAVRSKWGPMIDEYLLDREQLAMVAVLVDGEIGPTKLDLEMIDWLRHAALAHSVIATKSDKVKSSRRDHRKKELANACGLDRSDVVWVSTAKDINVDRMRGLFRMWLDRT